jgi:hypothetical protein
LPACATTRYPAYDTSRASPVIRSDFQQESFNTPPGANFTNESLLLKNSETTTRCDVRNQRPISRRCLRPLRSALAWACLYGWYRQTQARRPSIFTKNKAADSSRQRAHHTSSTSGRQGSNIESQGMQLESKLSRRYSHRAGRVSSLAI